MLKLLSASLAVLSGRPGWARAAPNGERRRLLDEVSFWGCQYQNIDIEALAASALDLIVVEPSLSDDLGLFISAEEVERLKRKPDGGRRLVLAYLSIGEADTKRWFWPERWRREAPDWLGPENTAWPGSHPVKYWDEAWAELLLGEEPGLLRQILDRGYDGALLDRVDAFADWTATVPDADERMVSLVREIGETARQRDGDFLLLPQNAEPLLRYRGYVDAIDAVNKESLLTGLECQNCLNSPSDVDWSLDYFRLVDSGEIKRLATEYVSDPAMIPSLSRELNRLGFTPFFGVRALDATPVARAP
ncbi:endo alpha-1,4 polygalactosaminidase [Fulvimarina endophytica]|nr:endo alpha-1,4 polygalactosaminidase [Fulvimarina endophytica]